jgi:hypothetical protein
MYKLQQLNVLPLMSSSAFAFASSYILQGASVAKSRAFQQVQEHAIYFIIHPAQHFDAFRDGGSAWDQILTSYFIQSHDGVHFSHLTNAVKSFQSVVFLSYFFLSSSSSVKRS